MSTAQPLDGPTLAALVEAVPEGWTRVRYEGRTYGLTRRTWAGGRSTSVLAEELGGTDLVSANVHRTATAHHLRPCEMPAAKVVDFLRGWEPTRSDGAQAPAR
jgi:hypothetical protein